MENYKLASRLKLRFQTEVGNCSTEQLWTLSKQQLDSLAVSLDAAVEKSTTKSFLTPKSEENKELKLKFDIVVDILNTLMKEEEELSNAYEVKKHNAKIDKLIAAKEDASLKDLSVEELAKLRK